MGARTQTGSHHRAAAPGARPLVAFAFSVVVALSGAWAPSAASDSPETQGESDVRPSRGPKPAERSCSRGESRRPETENPSNPGGDLGYRHHSAAPVQPAAASGGDSGGGCPEDEPGSGTSGGDQSADGRRAYAGPSGSSEARGPSSAGERGAPNSPPSGRPSASTPAPRSGVGPGGAKSDGRQGRPEPAAKDVSGVDDHRPGRAASGGPSPGSAGEQDRVAQRSPSGGGNASSGGRGRGTGGGNRRPGGSAGDGRGRDHSAAGISLGRAPGGGTGDALPGFRRAAANRIRLGGSVSVRVPGGALLSGGIPSTALSSPAAAALAAGGPDAVAATPIPRVSGGTSASTVLALLLLLVGVTLRRTVRAHRRTPA